MKSWVDTCYSCCDDQYTMDEIESLISSECSSCGAPLDKDGDPLTCCSYSPIGCDVCKTQWCDGSC